MDDCINKIYKEYLDTVALQIATFEAYGQQFPTSMLNEIRSMFVHIARGKTANDKAKAEKNVGLAERHLKRIQLDGNKFLCIYINDHYEKEINKFKNVDFSLVSDGEFAVGLSKREAFARKKFVEAKKIEILNDDFDDTFAAFDEAFNCWVEVIDYWENNIEKLLRAKHKTEKDKKVAYGIGITGALFGAISLAVYLIDLFAG